MGTASGVSTTSALVTWTAPADNGRSPITQYVATASPGGKSCTTTGATSCTVTGLTSGTTYTFTVVAKNAVGPSLASAASNSVTPRIPTALVLTAAPLTAVGGSAITVTGKLTRSDTAAAIVNHAVALQYRPVGSTGAFATLPTVVQTSTAGVAAFRVVLSRATQYRLVMAADATYNAATSALRNVIAVRSITIAPTARVVLLHHTFSITGRVAPLSKGARIYLQRKIGTAWSTRTSTLVSAASTYSIPIIAPTRGVLAYRTFIVGGPFLATSYSPVTTVTVR
jgi:serine protease